MIQLTGVTLARGATILIEGADLRIFRGQHIGLTGPNGSGKSSLLAALTGELAPEHGELRRQPWCRIAHVEQDSPSSTRPAVEFVLDADTELRAVEAQIESAQLAADGERLAHAHARFEEIGGYAARARARALLTGLGFLPTEMDNPVAQFSGGWRARLKLARALARRSDLLLLDEPTNHLDLDAVLWLEGWLKAYRGALLVVSHDRDFLDNVVGWIAHLSGRSIRMWRGNYSDSEQRRAAELAGQQAMFERQQQQIAALDAFVQRFRAKATKARQAQSRLKALARMEKLAPAHVDSPFTFRFREPAAQPDPLVVLDRVSAGYEGRRLLESVSLEVRAHARIGVLGRNGAGKSTLVRLLAGVLPPLSGERMAARGLAVAYFAQHQLEQLRADETALQHLLRAHPRAREQELRDFLGAFGFGAELAGAPVSQLSGGERSRLVLAMLIRDRPNLLLLDEPTNHLDLEVRHALTLALQEYEGAVVLVSHDRHLMRTTAEELLLVSDGTVSAFDGDLEDYRAWLEDRRGAGGGEPRTEAVTPTRRDRRREDALARGRRSALRAPIEREIASIEQSLAELEQEKRSTQSRLSNPARQAGSEVSAALRRHAEIVRRLEELEERWLDLHEELERLR
ncbi:MAG: ATP-binding cassette domain-containing protein [Rhodocyclaceae bacterium]